MLENVQNVEIPKRQTLNMSLVTLLGGAGSLAVLAMQANLLINAFDSDAVTLPPENSIKDQSRLAPPESLRDSINDLMQTIALEDLAAESGRRIASASDERFISVGKLWAGSEICTDSVVEFSEYYTTQDGILVGTAGHCVIGKSPSSITFSKTYVDESGAEVTYTTSATPQVWINSQYVAQSESAGPDWSGVSPHDTALVFFPNEALPKEIVPIEQYVFNYHLTHYNERKPQMLEMAAPGHSADLDHNVLSVDDKCDAGAQAYGQMLYASCVVNQGASGGPLIGENDLVGAFSLGVLSGMTTDGGVVNHHSENYSSLYAAFYNVDLHDVPFLRKKDVCAVVDDTDGANLRDAPTVYSSKNGPAIEGYNTTVKVSSMLDMEAEEVGLSGVWAYVTDTPDGRYGYIRRDLLTQVDCPESLVSATLGQTWNLRLK